MKQPVRSRLLAVLGMGLVAVVGLAALLMFLEGGATAPTPTNTSDRSISPSPTNLQTPEQELVDGDLAVATVNGRTISYSFWQEAVLIDQVVSGLAGQPIPTREETLQRLINEDLVLQTVPPDQTPTIQEVEAKIASLEKGWGVDDAAVVRALSKIGIDRAAFERSVQRLLAVQIGLAALERQGEDVEAWLKEQRARADIQIFEDVASLPLTYDQSPIATQTLSPIPTPPAETMSAPSVPETMTRTSVPTPAIPEIAPDFTLKQAGGGAFTLTEQLTEGPVVLVFFQKCG